jgi:predicted ArsR family transcriptional regulator
LFYNRTVPVTDRIAAVASLGDGVRRRLYEYVAGEGGSVGRDEAAAATGIKRPLAAYHLDRLVDQGLLQVHYERPAGRSGPGAGRPSKRYERAVDEVAVSLPPRHYDLAAELLATAVEESRSPETAKALKRAAQRLGREVGDELVARAGKLKGRDRDRRALTAVLQDRGYEPFTDDDGVVRLRNCPFHRLAADHTDLVCGMNLAMMKGVTEADADLAVRPVLEPRPGQCCVAFRERAPASE